MPQARTGVGVGSRRQFLRHVYCLERATPRPVGRAEEGPLKRGSSRCRGMYSCGRARRGRPGHHPRGETMQNSPNFHASCQVHCLILALSKPLEPGLNTIASDWIRSQPVHPKARQHARRPISSRPGSLINGRKRPPAVAPAWQRTARPTGDIGAESAPGRAWRGAQR